MYQDLEQITLRDLISFSCISNNRFFSIFNRVKIIIKKSQSITSVTLLKYTKINKKNIINYILYYTNILYYFNINNNQFYHYYFDFV